MIPRLSVQFGQRIHFDNTLHGISVNPLELNATEEECLLWIYGIANANELDVDVDGRNIFVKGRDFARHATLVAGPLREDFLEAGKGLGWDILPVAGRFIVEYPIAHREIISSLLGVTRIVSSYQVNCSVWDSTLSEKHGISVDEFTSFAIQNFDALHLGDASLIVGLPRLTLGNDKQSRILERNISALLSGTFGEEMHQEIATQRNFITTSRDALGQTVDQEVHSFESGLKITMMAYPLQDKVPKPQVFLNFSLEMSQDISTDRDQLPVIQRRLVKSSTKLGLDTVWQAATLERKSTARQDRKRYFLPYRGDEQLSEKVIVTVKRIQ